jgi:hypothetical protein
MCEKCEALQTKIQEYRDIAPEKDPLTTERINSLISELEQMLQRMHECRSSPAVRR